MTTKINSTCSKQRKQWSKWTEQEEFIIKTQFPLIGLNLTLPGRSRDDVRLKALRMGTKYKGQKTKQTPWENKPFEHRWLSSWTSNVPNAPASVWQLANQ